jgi:hypothetical protein
MIEAVSERRRPEERTICNPRLVLRDGGEPTLTSFFILESVRWGAVVFALFVLFRFVEPIFADDEDTTDVQHGVRE